jgi:hypothetical protein
LLQAPPKQLSPTPQECPQLPQFWLSLMKVALFTHCPIQELLPGPQEQKPPVQVSLNEHWLPHRPQFDESPTNEMLSLHCP